VGRVSKDGFVSRARVRRVLTACAMMLVMATVQIAMDQCAIACDRPPADASGAAAPACHHDGSPLARIGQPPANCNRQHRMAVVSAVDAAAVPRTVAPRTAAVVSAAVVPPSLAISAGPAAHAPDRIGHQRALSSPSPLRI
jgi:hypothetical protein